MEECNENFLVAEMKEFFREYNDQHNILVVNALNYMYEKLNETNEKFNISHYEQYKWLEGDCVMEFSSNNIPSVIAKAYYVGALEHEEWVWSWAEEGVNENCKCLVLELRELGEKYNIPFLRKPSFSATENIGWVMSAIFTFTFNADIVYKIERCNAVEFYVFKEIIKL